MADKVLRTKIALLYKTLEEWNEIADTYVPLKGEVCFCEVPGQQTSEEKEKDTIIFKVGNGTDVFAELPWASAEAVGGWAHADDVYAWAKKEDLDFGDLSNDFLTELDNYIQEQSGGLTYRIVKKEDNLWQLQQRSKDKPWEDVKEGEAVDLRDTLADIEDLLETKVDKEVVSSEATTKVVNEDGKAGVSIDDGTNEAFLGVEGGKAHYLKDGEHASDDTELVTKADIKDLESALKFIGATNREKDSEGRLEPVDEAIARLLEEKGIDEPKAGDVVLIDTAEYVYDGEVWKEIGDEGTYATKADLKAEVERAKDAEEALEDRIIDAEDRIDILEEEISDLFDSSGKIKGLADIAYTGDVNDLVQQDGDVLILNCNAE